jgi:hypothetical protein
MSSALAEGAKLTRGLTRLNELVAPTLARHSGRLGVGYIYRAEQIAQRVKPIAGMLSLPHEFAGMGAGGSALARGTSAFKFARGYADAVPGLEAILKESQRFGPAARVGFKALGPIGVGLDVVGGRRGGSPWNVAERVGFNALAGAAFGPEGALVAGGLTLAQELAVTQRRDSLADMRRYYRRGYVSPFMPFVRPERPPTRAQLHRSGSALGDSIAHGLEHGPGFLNGGLGLPPAEIVRQARSELVGLPAPARLSAAQRLIEWTRVQQAAGNLWPGTTSGVMAGFRQVLPQLGGFLRSRGEGSPWQLTRTLVNRGTESAARGQVSAVSGAHKALARELTGAGRDIRAQWLTTMRFLGDQTQRGTQRARTIARSELGQMTRFARDNGQQLANWLTRPFTQPLASSVHKAGTLSRGNVAAIITQFRRLSPQMRQVTASALRDQVQTMEAHRQVLRGTTRALVASINSQWPKIDPASRRAVTQAITHMSARMVDGRRVLNPQAVKLAEGIRSSMQGPFGRIVKDFGTVVSDLVSTAKSVGSAISSTGSLVSLSTHRSSSGSSSPPKTYAGQVKKFRHLTGMDGSNPLLAAMSVAGAAAHPGVGGASIGSTVHAGLGQLVHRMRSIAGGRPKQVASAMRGLRRLLGDTENVTYGRIDRLGASVRRQLAELRRGGLRGREVLQARRLGSVMSLIDREMSKRVDATIAGARRVLNAISRRQTATSRRLAIQGVDEGGLAGLGALQGDDQAALRQLASRRAALQRELARARKRRDRRAISAISRELGEIDDTAGGLEANIATRGWEIARLQRYQPNDVALAMAQLTGAGSQAGGATGYDDDLAALQARRSLLEDDLAHASSPERQIELANELKSTRDQIESLQGTIEQQNQLAQQRMDLDRELADNQRRMLAVAESQPNVLLGGLVAAINGGIGGRVGLGFQTPGYAGRGVRY